MTVDLVVDLVFFIKKNYKKIESQIWNNEKRIKLKFYVFLILITLLYYDITNSIPFGQKTNNFSFFGS